jgi:4-hydroxy-tetrahydrodipicolinate reductase
MRIGIAGITGRMGSMLADQIRALGETVTGGIDRTGRGPISDITALAAISDVVMDFTDARATQGHAVAMQAAGKPWVIGTSGLSDLDEAALTAAASKIPVVYSSNFAPGAALVLALAERMAAALPMESYDAEIVEMHHRQKVDAPSGTAIGMGRAVARGRGQDFNAVMDVGRNGHTGPRVTGNIGFAALRGGQVVGEHTLIFAAGSEHIALSHRAFDRAAFAEGAVLAARWIIGRPPGLYSMLDVLGVRI